jgi:hypothetical protein
LTDAINRWLGNDPYIQQCSWFKKGGEIWGDIARDVVTGDVTDFGDLSPFPFPPRGDMPNPLGINRPNRPNRPGPESRSRIPNRRPIPTNPDGTVTITRAPRDDGELDGASPRGRFYGPPGYEDVARDYACRQGYCGLIEEIDIPYDVYVDEFLQYEYRLDGTRGELELPRSVADRLSQFPRRITSP